MLSNAPTMCKSKKSAVGFWDKHATQKLNRSAPGVQLRLCFLHVLFDENFRTAMDRHRKNTSPV